MIHADQPFTIEVIAIGNHIIVKLDGKTSVDFFDLDNPHLSGFLGLRQIEGTEIRFVSIQVREL